MEISHLAKLPQLEGLCVLADLTLRDEEGGQVLARAASSGVLERME